MREQRVGLEHHGDVALRRREVRYVLAADQDAAARNLLKAGDQTQRRRFAAARRSEQHEERSRVGLEAHGVDGLAEPQSLLML